MRLLEDSSPQKEYIGDKKKLHEIAKKIISGSHEENTAEFNIDTEAVIKSIKEIRIELRTEPNASIIGSSFLALGVQAVSTLPFTGANADVKQVFSSIIGSLWGGYFFGGLFNVLHERSAELDENMRVIDWMIGIMSKIMEKTTMKEPDEQASLTFLNEKEMTPQTGWQQFSQNKLLAEKEIQVEFKPS